VRGEPVRPVVIAAGGTGGHLFPAAALAAELARRNRRVVLMTDRRTAGTGGELFAGREQFVIRGAGIAGRGAVRGMMAAAALGIGTLQARAILAQLQAEVLVGFGGYPSVAPVLATRMLRQRPAVLLHEQNAVLGRANRALARYADRLALSFAATARIPDGARTAVTGNPVRAAIVASPYEPAAADGPVRVLVLGGSLGARVLSEVVPSALTRLPPALRARLQVVQQCRAEDLARVRATYTAAAIPAELDSFFVDAPARLAAAHLVIARAGASTVAELAAIGRPAILVPLPGAIDDHQAANARALADAGAAWTIAQPAFTPEELGRRIGEVLAEPERLARAAASAASLGRADAAARVADLVVELASARASAGATP
jgi:UDP-N-acetylglucosamine--N-acetylmuramyl-(pentapeptide) pyrophosphoryl-undecaprenol N-acetylglucosamine transferase